MCVSFLYIDPPPSFCVGWLEIRLKSIISFGWVGFWVRFYNRRWQYNTVTHTIIPALPKGAVIVCASAYNNPHTMGACALRCIVYISTHMATESAPFTYLFTYFAYISDISLTTCGILTKQQSPCRETRALLSYREVGVERFELPTSSL